MSTAPPTPSPAEGPPPLPGRVALPAAQSLRRHYQGYVLDNHVRYVLNTAWALAAGTFAGHAAVAVEERDDLEPVCWCAFPVEVDGVRVVVDFSDCLVLDPAWTGYDHWLRFHYTDAFRPFPRLGVFSQQSFHDWAAYRQIVDEVREARAPGRGVRVLNNQALGPDYDSRYRRRALVRGMLQYHFGAAVDGAWSPQPEFWRKAQDALCYVHVPGTFPSSPDRAWMQMLALGVPVVSPRIPGYVGGGGPAVPGVHYLACRDDYADLVAVVRRCATHREEAFAVGAAGRALFRAQATPPAVWATVLRHLGAPGGCIDCDLPTAEVRCNHPA